MGTGSARGRGRAAAVVGLIAAALVPLAGTAATVWTTTGADIASVRAERQGALYLGATVKLLVVVADAQSAAVRGTPPSPADLAAAVGAVDSSGLPQDPDPGTGTLWAQIRPQILALSGSATTGEAAYQAYSQVTDLILQQITGIDDASGLVLDPKGDSYHLVVALTMQLPDMAVQAGRFDDLVTLAAGRGAKLPADARAASTARIAVVRDRIAVDAHAFVSALDKVFRSTASASLGPHLLGDVDLVNTDVNALAPTASVADDGLVIPTADEVSADRQAFDPAVLVLETAGRAELDVLLEARESGYQRQRLDVLLLIVGGAVVALPSAWWVLRRRAGKGHAAEEQPEGRAPRPTARLGRRSSLRERSAPKKKSGEAFGNSGSAESDVSGDVAPARRPNREIGPDRGASSDHAAVPGSAFDTPRQNPIALPTRRPAAGPARVGHEIGRSDLSTAPPDPAHGSLPRRGDR